MAVWRRGLLALLLVAASAGCAHGAADDQATSSSPPSSRASSTVPLAVSTSAPGPVVTSSPPSSSVPSSSVRPTAPPPLSAKARAAGLIDIRTVVPDAIVDLRYATTDNFVGVRLYPTDARCLVHESMVAGLVAAARQLRHEGDALVFWDCYRPHAVQVHMFKIVPDPNWVARPGPFATSHEAARSVDVTLAHAVTGRQCPPSQRVQHHCLLDMGTGFDDFTPRAYAFATNGVSAVAQSNRARLRTAMNSGDITVYSGEWWHFDGPGASVERPHLHAPLT
jgi:D-alanyl-D-alanine dipeptidase